MFQWSKKVVKSVTFEPGVADESLLALVESYLEKQPDKTFSDLCKEALWQSLCVLESVKPNQIAAVKSGSEQKIAELESQLANLEERFFAKESHRLEAMERQMMQLSQQVAQLAIAANQQTAIQSVNYTAPALDVVHSNSTPNHVNAPPPPADVDPLISRLSQFLEDF
ncbi:MAG: plasmid segregation centromere-binding protein ParR [Richelia sp.]|nr:plasmid segregation centromere-binding protein ParR [Richelia sp.]